MGRIQAYLIKRWWLIFISLAIFTIGLDYVLFPLIDPGAVINLTDELAIAALVLIEWVFDAWAETRGLRF